MIYSKEYSPHESPVPRLLAIPHVNRGYSNTLDDVSALYSIVLWSYFVTWIPSARPDWVKADKQREMDRCSFIELKFQCHRNATSVRYAHNNGNADNYRRYSFPSCPSPIPPPPLRSSVEIMCRFRFSWKRSYWSRRRPCAHRVPRAYRRIFGYECTFVYGLERKISAVARRVLRAARPAGCVVATPCEHDYARFRVSVYPSAAHRRSRRRRRRRAFFFSECASDLLSYPATPRAI